MALTTTTEILGEEKEVYAKTVYFATNFNGECEVKLGNFLSKEAREKNIENGVRKRPNIEYTDEVKEKLDLINGLVYDILKLQKEFENSSDA